MAEKNGRGEGRIHTIKKFIRFLLVLINNIYVIPSYVVWTWVLWPIHYLSLDLYWTLEGYIGRWMFAMVAFWMWSADYKVVEVGDDVTMCTEDESLVLLNHQSTSDVPVVMNLVQNKGPAGSRMMWIMDRIFMYTQFGVASMQRGDFFIQQGKEGRDHELTRLGEHMRKVYPATRKQWIILFPEGGFLWKRREASQRYAKKNGYPLLQHVTLPRIGAMQVIMKELSPKASNGSNSKFHIPKGGSTLKWIIDVTIAYEEEPILDLPAVIHGGHPACITTVHYRVYRADLVPTDTEGLTKWVYQRYIEKEKLLDEFYRTGKFPVSATECNGNMTIKEPRLITYNAMWFLGLHVFYLASTWLHCKMIASAWSLAMMGLGLLF